jgi:hypothetical protein
VKRIHPTLVLLVLALFVAGGCYTVLRHPATYTYDYDWAEDHSGQKVCADCHADADLYHYVEAYGGSWYNTYPDPWAYYYQSPWWYGDYWYYESDDGIAGPIETGERHLWSRGGRGTDLLPSQGEQIQSAPSPNQSNPSSSGTEEKPKEKPKKKRRVWSR